MSFTYTAERGFTSSYDDTEEAMSQYLAYCDSVGKIGVMITEESDKPMVVIDVQTMRAALPQIALDRLAQLAARHGAEEDPMLENFAVFTFRQLDHAEKFAAAAVDWLRRSNLFEPARPYRQIDWPLVECSDRYVARGDH